MASTTTVPRTKMKPSPALRRSSIGMASATWWICCRRKSQELTPSLGSAVCRTKKTSRAVFPRSPTCAKDNPPIITIHGDADDVVPYTQAVRLREALDKAGVPNELFTVKGGGHGQFTDEDNRKAYAEVWQFLAKYPVGTGEVAFVCEALIAESAPHSDHVCSNCAAANARSPPATVFRNPSKRCGMSLLTQYYKRTFSTVWGFNDSTQMQRENPCFIKQNGFI